MSAVIRRIGTAVLMFVLFACAPATAYLLDALR
jgi:hypothetical protein